MSEAYDYAVMLLESIVKKHYSPVEGFAPFDRPDVVGVLTQIDNAVAGISQQLAEARGEIERKDALIEQMREALKAIDAIGSEKGDASRDDALRCFSIARAALAAERGE